MFRKIAIVLVGLSFVAPGAFAATGCDGKMTELKPRVAAVTDAKTKQNVTAHWTKAETALKAKKEKACMQQVAYIEKALKSTRM